MGNAPSSSQSTTTKNHEQSKPIANGGAKVNGNGKSASVSSIEQPLSALQTPQKGLVVATDRVSTNGTSKTDNISIHGETNSHSTPAAATAQSGNTGTSGGGISALAACTSTGGSNGSDTGLDTGGSEAALAGGPTTTLGASDERSDISSIGSGTTGSMG